MRQTYLDDDESREWLLDGPARILSPEDKAFVRQCRSAFVIYGNEDAPERIDIYATTAPAYTDTVLFVLLPDADGVLRKAFHNF